jgi:putative ABC transport system permease protein
MTMIKNYFKIAWRNLWKNKTFTMLNLGGLTISLAACLIIFFWVKDELNYDTAGANADRVFRVALILQAKGQPDKQFAETAAPLAPVLVKDFPEIEKAVRLDIFNALIGYKTEHFFTNKFLFADSTFFDVFGFPMVEGNPHSALLGSNSVVITESLAKKYFGSEDAIGKIITYSDTILLKVTGVAKDLPATSHFYFDMVCAFGVLERNGIDDTSNWWSDNYFTYILLKDKNAAPTLGVNIRNIMDTYYGKQNKQMGFAGLHFLQPLKSIHLRSQLGDEINPNGSISSLRIFIAIAIFLLIVACINYINLTTATSFKRAKEIGIRKVVGAQLRQLICQFLSESILITMAAMLGALCLCVACLPAFNKAAGTQISFSSQFSWSLIVTLMAFGVVLAIISGIYPAIYLSSVRPVKVLKNIIEKKGSLLSLRKTLVIFQFTLSVILIVATIVAIQQLRYMQSHDLGFVKEQVVAVPLHNLAEGSAQGIVKKEFETNHNVTSTSASFATPGKGLANNVVLPEGVSPEHSQTMNTLAVDYDFANTYKLTMMAGRYFSKNYGGDSSGVILNETAVKELGWGNPEMAIGKTFGCFGKKGTVIGVVKDFHFNSLHQKVTALVMHMERASSGWYNYISARLNTQNIQQTIEGLQTAWKKALPGHPFEYFFVDEDYNKQYQIEQRLSNLSVMFSVLTIFISCLGLFGLVMIAVSQRTKEIGVRKVLGASVSVITALLSKDFLTLVVIAIIFALPVSWWLMNKWLMDFAYRIGLSWWMFALAALLVVCIALATVSFQAIKAAIANPVKSLRNE